MNTVQSHILPHLPEAYGLLSGDPTWCAAGFSDLPTLMAILWLLVISQDGDGWWMLKQAMSLTYSFYSEAEIQSVLNQFEGEDPARHLWRRNSNGNYRLLI